jgi:hypothetical protein
VRDGYFLNDEDCPADALRQARSAAEQAGFDLKHPQVQVAVLQLVGQLRMAQSTAALHHALERCGDYLRELGRRS